MNGVNSLINNIFVNNIFERLGLSWQEILFHLISLVVLVIALWFLLYKPVKRIIKERRDQVAEVYATNARLRQDAENTKDQYERLLTEARLQAASVATEASIKAQERVATIMQEAQQKSEAIVDTAYKETLIERTQMHNEFRLRAADIVIEIAGKIIDKELDKKTNDRLINDALDSWEK